ncbi:hypothetical protein [Flavobacterium sp.]|uniref:hypothetical protein n=1 Tax=Flavobacterium sp. TaxID=239 RepID=UPI0039E567E7
MRDFIWICMKKALWFLWLVFVVSACDGNDRTGVQSHTIADQSPVFKVTVEVQAAQDDTFALYYTTDGSIDFSSIKPVWAKIKGSPKPQKVVFKLPQKVVPTELRIDLGQNPDQREIYLQKIWMSYHGKAVEFPGTLIFSYFRPDFNKTEINATTGMVRGIVKKGVKQSPSLYPKAVDGPLHEQILKLTATEN